jgi:hypothetical protein
MATASGERPQPFVQPGTPRSLVRRRPVLAAWAGGAEECGGGRRLSSLLVSMSNSSARSIYRVVGSALRRTRFHRSIRGVSGTAWGSWDGSGILLIKRLKCEPQTQCTKRWNGISFPL